jgi:hypothetical protein
MKHDPEICGLTDVDGKAACRYCRQEDEESERRRLAGVRLVAMREDKILLKQIEKMARQQPGRLKSVLKEVVDKMATKGS